MQQDPGAALGGHDRADAMSPRSRVTPDRSPSFPSRPQYTAHEEEHEDATDAPDRRHRLRRRSACRAARGGPGRRAGRRVRLAVGQPAAAGQHHPRAVVRRRAGLRGRRLRHAAAHDRRRRDVDRPAQRHVHRPHRGPGDRRRLASSRAAAASRAAPTTAARRSSALAFTPGRVELPRAARRGWFVSRATGYLVLTDGTVLRTDNDGDTFAQRNALPGTRAQSGTAQPTDVVFLTDQVGLAATADGHVYRTVDGATSWTLVSTTTGAVRSLAFVDALHGVAVGDGGLYPTTADGGTTWTPQDLGVGPVDLGSRPLRDGDELPGDDEDGRAARARRRRRGRPAARHAFARPDLRRGVRLAEPDRRRRRERGHRGLRRRRAHVRPGRRPPHGPVPRDARGRPGRRGVRSGRERHAGQDGRRRADVDERQRLDVRGRARRLVPDEHLRVRARRLRRPVPHARRRRDLAAARHRLDRAAPRPSWRRARRRCSSPARTASAARPTAATPSPRRRIAASRRRPSRRSTSRGARSSSPAPGPCSARPTAAARGGPSAARRASGSPARSTSSTPARASGWGPTARVPHARRRPALDAAARRRHRRRRRHGVLERDPRLPHVRPLRRRDDAVGLPAAHDRRRRDVAPAVRRLDPDPGRTGSPPAAAGWTTCSAARRACCSRAAAATPGGRAA